MTSAGNAADKRKYPRVLNPSLLYILNDPASPDSPNPTMLLHDISASGFSFFSEKEYPAAQSLEVDIKLPGEGFSAQASVVRSEYVSGMYLIGARFAHETDADEKQLLERIRF